MERLPNRLEVTDMLAGLEVLGQYGVTAEHWNDWRRKAAKVQQVAGLIMGDEYGHVDYRDQLRACEQLYQRLGWQLDTTGLRIPPRPSLETFGPSCLLVIAQGLTLNKTYDTCAKLFPCWKYVDDLNAAVPTNDRDPVNGAYAIWVCDGQEADKEWRNISANRLKKKGIQGETLLERLIHELNYFETTGKHLEVQSITLCSGSRNVNGNVPYVSWNGDKLIVYWHNSSYANDNLRCREVVA